MIRKNRYREVQDRKIWWVKLLIIAINVLSIGTFAYGLYSQMVLNHPFGDNPMSNNALIWNAILVVLLMVVVDWILFRIKLETEIDADSVRFRMSPLIRKYRVYHRDEIESWEVRTYKPIREYGGWGIRRKKLRYRLKQRHQAGSSSETVFQKIAKRSMAYTLNGTLGLQLYLKNGRDVLIGTQRRDAIEKAMKQMMEKG